MAKIAQLKTLYAEDYDEARQKSFVKYSTYFILEIFDEESKKLFSRKSDMLRWSLSIYHPVGGQRILLDTIYKKDEQFRK